MNKDFCVNLFGTRIPSNAEPFRVNTCDSYKVFIQSDSLLSRNRDSFHPPINQQIINYRLVLQKKSILRVFYRSIVYNSSID